MKKLYLLGALGMTSLLMSGVTKHYTEYQLQKMAEDGKARVLPTDNVLKTKKAEKKFLHSRDTGHHSGITLLPHKNATEKKHNSPLRLTPEGGTVYGYLTYNYMGDIEPGMYELTPDGFEMCWVDPVWWDYYEQASNGWYVDGKIQGVQTVTWAGYLNEYFTYVIDFETGMLEDFTPIDIYDTEIFELINVYNPQDGLIYGYAYNWKDDANIYWTVADFNNIIAAQPIKYASDDFCYSLCYNATDGCFYGVNINQEFVKVDLDGTQSYITDVPDAENMATYVTGLVWNPVTNLFYWNYVDKQDETGLYSITEDGTFNFLTAYPSGEEFSYFFTTDEVIDPTKPTRPEVESVSFADGAMEGTVSFILPDTFGDGAPLPSPIEYTATLDGEAYLTGSAAPGSTVTIEYNIIKRGFHSFGLYVTVNGVNSYEVSTRIYVGMDNPLPPPNVKLSPVQISWDAVTGGANGGYVNVSDMTYEVSLNDEVLGTTAETTWAVTLPEDKPLQTYTASVVAICEGLQSLPSTSNSVVAGTPFTVPMYLEPTSEEFDLMTVADENGDGQTWSYNTDYNAVYSTYSMSYDIYMDDYLFMPPVKIESTDSYYSFSFESAIRSANYGEEYVSVVFASSPMPSGVEGTITEPFTPAAIYNSGEPWQISEGLWKVPAPGTYYIGLHCTSAGDQFGLYARNFSLIKTDITENSPAAVSDLSATPGPQGALEATVTFTLPSVTLNGEALGSGVTLFADVTVAGSDELESVTGTPGSTKSVTVRTNQGTNTINVVVYNGDLESPKSEVKVYTGVAAPATPQNVEATEAPDMMSALLTWEPVTTAYEEGGYVDPADITYDIYVYRDYGFYATWVLWDENITGNSYTFSLNEGDPQEMYALGVVSKNIAGNNGHLGVVQNVFLGTPYALPLSMSIDVDDATVTPEPWYQYSGIYGMNYAGKWYLDYVSYFAEDYEGEDMPAMVGFPTGDGICQGAVGIPRFSTKNCKTVEIAVDHIQGPNSATFMLLAQIYGSDDLIEIGMVEGNTVDISEIITSTFSLPDELMNRDWVQVYIIADYYSLKDLFIMTGCQVTSTSSITSYEADTTISSGKNTIFVRGCQGKDVTISALDGKKIVSETIKSYEAAFNVEKGVYVVKTDRKSAKVIVK